MEKKLFEEIPELPLGALVQKNCPWSDFLPGTISFCEERLCALVVEPANTWSNIGYLIVGIIIALHARKKYGSFLHFFSITPIYLFFGSSLFHATGTFWGEVLDVSAMFLLSLAMLTINLKRYYKFDLKRTYLLFISGFALSVILLLLIKPIGIPLFALQILTALGLELLLFKKSSAQAPSYKHFRWALGFFAIAFFFWILDITKIVCVPTNHYFTGHSAWHLLNAFTIYYLYRFYDPLLSESPTRE